jgi:hypothetical protein
VKWWVHTELPVYVREVVCICAVGLGFVCIVFGGADIFYSMSASPCISTSSSWTFSLDTIFSSRLKAFLNASGSQASYSSNIDNAQPITRLEQPGSWNSRRRCAFTTLARPRQCTRSSPAVCLWGSSHLSDSFTNEWVAFYSRSPKSNPKIRASSWATTRKLSRGHTSPWRGTRRAFSRMAPSAL